MYVMTHGYGKFEKQIKSYVYSFSCGIKTFSLVRGWKKLNYSYENTTYINQYGHKNSEELNGKH